MDPFAVLGLEPRLDLDAKALERAYLDRSRAVHPDFHQNARPEQQAEMLARAAELNDAWRVLRDPWRRAQALVDRLDPKASERTKQLSCPFLVEAMELAEEVAATNDPAPLRERLRRQLEHLLAQTRSHLDAGRADAAATAVHQSRYFQKALADLEARVLAAGQR